MRHDRSVDRSSVARSAGPLQRDARADVFVVGATGTIIHYDRTTWTPMTSGTVDDRADVWGSGPTDVWAVGPTTVLHYDGIQWSPTAACSGANAVWGSSADHVIFVGDGGSICRYCKNGVCP